MPAQPYFPTVLIVDDDPACTRYWREKFHSETSVGVVVANNLQEGRQLLAEGSIHIDGVVADLFFEDGTDDPDNDLYNGIQLLAYGMRIRPAIRQYVASFFADRNDYLREAQKAGVAVERWFQKAWHTAGQERLPWHEIERDLIKARLVTDNQAQEKLEALGLGQLQNLDAVSVAVQNLKLPTRTYLQEFHTEYRQAGLQIKRPIEVVCFWQQDGGVWASAPRLGLLTDGKGENIEDAIDDLQGRIISTKSFYDIEPQENLQGYALHVKQQLDLHLAREER